MWPITQLTHDPHDPWPMSHDHDMTLFHHAHGIGGGVTWWYWTTFLVLGANKIVDYDDGTNSVSEQFLNVNYKNKNHTLLGTYFIIMGQWVTGSDPRPMWLIQKWRPIILTHDPWPSDPFPSLNGIFSKLMVLRSCVYSSWLIPTVNSISSTCSMVKICASYSPWNRGRKFCSAPRWRHCCRSSVCSTLSLPGAGLVSPRVSLCISPSQWIQIN